MRILQVVHQFLPWHVGGTEVYVESLARELQRRGHQVAVFCGGVEEQTQHDLDGLRVYTTGQALGPGRHPLRTFLAGLANRTAEARFASACDEMAPEVVHFHHLMGLSPRLVSLAARRGIRTVLTLHDYWFLCPNAQLLTAKNEPCPGPGLGLTCGVCSARRLAGYRLAPLGLLATPLFLLRARMVRRVIEQADLVLAPSRFLRDLMVRGGFQESRIVLLPLGLDITVAIRRESREGPLRLAYLGSIAWQKGVHVLVDAVSTLPRSQVELRIYGDVRPGYGQWLQQRTACPNVRFMGRVQRQDVGTVLSEADAVVVPSLWYENFPLVVQEAFAAGVPVVASHLGALSELVADGQSGLLFRPGDAADLAAKLCLLADRDLLGRLKRGVPRVKGMAEHALELEGYYSGLRSA